MKTLCWDTSTAVTAVAALEGDRVVAQERAGSPDRHGDTLLPRVRDQLAAAGWDRLDVQLLAVGLGPGSFTGLRIGLATAKGWALATGVPVVGVPSHVGLAVPLLLAGHRHAVVLTDAFKGEVYASVYAAGEDGRGPRSLGAAFNAVPQRAVEQVLERLPPGPFAVAGDGLRRHPDEFDRLWDAGGTDAGAQADTPCPVALARQALVQYNQDGPSDLVGLEPLYVRGSDAKLPDAPLSL